MKRFSETQKAERALASSKGSKKQPAPNLASNDGGEEEDADEGDGDLPTVEGRENGGGGGEGTNASPRNKTLLSKLGTRLRGGAGRGKKSSSTTTGSKKSKE